MYKLRITNSLGTFDSDVLEDSVDDIYRVIANGMKSSDEGVFRVNTQTGHLVLSFELLKQSVVQIIEAKE